MPALTITPDGGSPITVPTAARGGFEIVYPDTQILERMFDGSAASVTINGSTTSRRDFQVRTPAITRSDRISLQTELMAVGEVTADGDLLDAALVCRVSDLSWHIEEITGYEILEFMLREVGS